MKKTSIAERPEDRLERVSGIALPDAQRLAQLVRDGIVRLARVAAPRETRRVCRWSAC